MADKKDLPGDATSDYFPYTSSQEKIDTLKKEISRSLDLCVHPEHLNRIYKKLDKLKEFWAKDLKRKGRIDG